MPDHTNEQAKKPKRVAVVYHYFAHYREPVNLALINGSPHEYHFYGETHSFGTGIKLTDNFPNSRFHRLRALKIGPLFLQPGLLLLALSPKHDALVMLGNAKWPCSWIAAVLARLTGKRVLFWTHGWLRVERGKARAFRNAFYKLANALLVYGHRAKAIGTEHMGFDPSRIHVIYNSLDTDAQDACRATLTKERIEREYKERFGDRAHLPTIINVTRLHEYKRVDMIITAAAKLRAQGKDVNVIIVGDGPHKPEIEKLAQELGVRAVFTGALYDEETIAALISGASVTVMPGPVGLLVMHALAYGCPVVSNDDFDAQMPEFEAIVEGVSGSYFHAGDADSLAQAIARWTDPAARTDETREQARRMITGFYNPHTQQRLIDAAVEGAAPDDLGFPRTRVNQGIEP